MAASNAGRSRSGAPGPRPPTGKRNRRLLRNRLLEPRIQLRYGAYFFLFSAAAILLASAVILRSARGVIGRILEQAGPEATALRWIVEDAVLTAALQSAWLLPLFGIAGMVFGILVTHRILGPLVRIRRQIDALTRGEYDARCELRSGDELQDLADGLNGLGEALQRRQRREPDDDEGASPSSDESSDRPTGDRSGSTAGFSIMELLVVLMLLSVLGMLAASQLIRAFDRSRQRATLADMRSIGLASEAYRVDHGTYADALADLEPYHTQVVPPVDRWGFAWGYSGGDDYTLTSYGTDGVEGPAPPDPWFDEPFEPDLVLRTGVFVQTPGDSR